MRYFYGYIPDPRQYHTAYVNCRRKNVAIARNEPIAWANYACNRIANGDFLLVQRKVPSNSAPKKIITYYDSVIFPRVASNKYFPDNITDRRLLAVHTKPFSLLAGWAM